jgi:hypothetical protein
MHWHRSGRSFGNDTIVSAAQSPQDLLDPHPLFRNSEPNRSVGIGKSITCRYAGKARKIANGGPIRCRKSKLFFDGIESML